MLRRLIPHAAPFSHRTPTRYTYPLLQAVRTMSAEAHPVSSTSKPAPPAEGINPITPAAHEGKKKEKKEKKDKKGGGASGPLELSPPPEFFAERLKIYDEWKAKYDKFVTGKCPELCLYVSIVCKMYRRIWGYLILVCDLPLIAPGQVIIRRVGFDGPHIVLYRQYELTLRRTTS